jgi:hypothetical protein
MGKRVVLSRFIQVFLSALLFLILTPFQSLAGSIRSVEADDTNVVVVKTATAFSTILEFQSKPISAVLGDQDSFKLEYVGNSITLKPLVPHAESNLFVFTEYERFNCQIVTVPRAQVDYIVRIRSKVKAYPIEEMHTRLTPVAVRDSKRITRTLNRSASRGGIRMTVRSVSREAASSDPRSATLIDFTLSSQVAPWSFQPQAITVTQLGKAISIESLYLDGLELNPGAPAIHGKLALLAQDFDPKLPVRLVFDIAKHRIAIAIPGQGPPKPRLNEKKTDEKGK